MFLFLFQNFQEEFNENYQPEFFDIDMKVSDSQYSFFNKLSAYHDLDVEDGVSPTTEDDQHKTFVMTTPTSHHDDTPSLEGLKRETSLSCVGNDYYQMKLSRDANSSPQQQTSCDDSSDPKIKEDVSISEVMADTELLNLDNWSIPHRDKPDQSTLSLSDASLGQSHRLVSSEFTPPVYHGQPKIKDDSDYVLPPATQANSNVDLVGNGEEVFYLDDFSHPMSENLGNNGNSITKTKEDLALVSPLDIDRDDSGYILPPAAQAHSNMVGDNEDPITGEDFLAIPLDIDQTIHLDQPKIRDDSGYILPPAAQAHSNMVGDNEDPITGEDFLAIPLDIDRTIHLDQPKIRDNSGYILPPAAQAHSIMVGDNEDPITGEDFLAIPLDTDQTVHLDQPKIRDDSGYILSPATQVNSNESEVFNQEDLCDDFGENEDAITGEDFLALPLDTDLTVNLDQPKIKDNSGYILSPATQVNSNESEVFNQEDLCDDFGENEDAITGEDFLALPLDTDLTVNLDQPKIKDNSGYILSPATQVNSNESEVFSQEDLCNDLGNIEDAITGEDFLAIPLDIDLTVNLDQPKIKDDSGYVLPPATQVYSNRSEIFDQDNLCEDFGDNDLITEKEFLTIPLDIDQTVNLDQPRIEDESGYILPPAVQAHSNESKAFNQDYFCEDLGDNEDPITRENFLSIPFNIDQTVNLDQPKIKDDSRYILPPAPQTNSNESKVFNQDEWSKDLCGNEDLSTGEDFLPIPLDIYQTVNFNQPKIKEDSGYILPPATEAHSNVDKVCDESEFFDLSHPLYENLSDNKDVITGESLHLDINHTVTEYDDSFVDDCRHNVTMPQFTYQSDNSSSGYISNLTSNQHPHHPYIHSDLYTA